jgi:TPR repeat protein
VATVAPATTASVSHPSGPAAAPPALNIPTKLAAVQPPPWYDDDSELLVDSCDTAANSTHDLDRVAGATGLLDRDVKAPQAIADCKRALEKYPDNRHLAYNLARAYDLNKDYANAKLWYEQAAEAGSAAAMDGLGNLYMNGNGVTEDDNLAAAWFQKSADLGDADGMLNLGILYESGLGVPEDSAMARKWYTASSKAGNAGAQALLDMMEN